MSGNAVANDVVETVLALRHASPRASWGATKILAFWPEHIDRPSRATVTRILKDYRRSISHRSRPLRRVGPPAPATAANDVWAIDGKGLWRGTSPLTVLDVHSRFLLALANTPVTTSEVQRITGRLFDEQGLPQRIRCDGGSPFGGNGLAQLSRLALWWIDLGITVEHVAIPQHNGHIERLHRTIEQEASHELSVDEALTSFRETYNDDRPHESLGGRTPREAYKPLPTAPPARFVARYDDERVVKRDGYFKWKGQRLFLSEALSSRTVTFRVLEEQLWLVRYAHMPLALLDERLMKLRPCPRHIFEHFT